MGRIRRNKQLPIVNKTQTILDLSATQVREYLMQETAYCDIELPPYFVFDSLLNSVAQSVGNRRWSDLYTRQGVRNQGDVNYRLSSNKDGRYYPSGELHLALGGSYL